MSRHGEGRRISENDHIDPRAEKRAEFLDLCRLEGACGAAEDEPSQPRVPGEPGELAGGDAGPRMSSSSCSSPAIRAARSTHSSRLFDRAA